MRLDRILALTLVVICLIAAIGNWVSDRAPRAEAPSFGMTSAGPANIALFPIRGTISSAEGGAFADVNPNADDIVKGLRRAEEDDIKAILLQINSPGGSAAASQEIYDELIRIREETEIPIVASFGDVAASGGYYIASAANHIVANPSTITGSIGVIIQSIKVFELLNQVGVEATIVKSGPYKDILSPFRETTAAELDILQSLVDEIFEEFLQVVGQGRDIPVDEVRALADGRIYTGTQALELNLVDSLGNYSDAIAIAADLGGIPGEPVIQNYLAPVFPDVLNTFFTAQLEKLFPGYETARLLRWNKVPLMLME